VPLKLVKNGHYDPEGFAREFARRHERRVRRYSTVTTGGIEKQFTVSVREVSRPTWRITCDSEAVTGELDRSLPTGMKCSVGAPWPHGMLESRFRAGRKGEFPVFITSQHSERVPELVRDRAFLAALDVSELAPSECLQTVSGIGFVFMCPTQQRVEAAFAVLEKLSNSFETKVARALPSRYPGSLRPISSLVLEWGIVDRAVRAQRIAEAHPDALRRLMGSARYYAGRIQTYLERTRLPHSDSAQIVKAFVQAVALAEARMQGVEALTRHRRTPKPRSS
jgi:hypothetical protein